MISANELEDLIEDCLNEHCRNGQTIEDTLVAFTEKLGAMGVVDLRFRWSFKELAEILTEKNTNEKLTFVGHDDIGETDIRYEDRLIGTISYGDGTYLLRWWADETLVDEEPRVFKFISTDEQDYKRFGRVMDEINEVVKIIENAKKEND